MRRSILVVAAVAVVLGLNIYFRLYPVSFPQLKDQARSMVEESIKQGAAQEVLQRFPQYDPLARDRLIASRVADYKKSSGKAIGGQVRDVYAKLKERFQDESGQTYLMELDCWHWARYVKNVVNLGHPGDAVRDGKQYDSLMLAPSGDPLAWNQFNFYFAAALYKAFSMVRQGDVFTFLFYLPLLYITAFILLLFFFVRRLSGTLAAVIASLIIGLSPMFIPRSCAGWFDMDVLNMFFPLVIVWTHVNAVIERDPKRSRIWNMCSAFAVGLFCYTWVNWWYIFFIIVMHEAFSIGMLAFARRGQNGQRRRDDLRGRSMFVLTFVGMSLVWVMVFSRLEAFAVWYAQIREALVLNKPLLPSIWPNVFSTVGELRRLNIRELTESLGGPAMALAMAVSVVAYFIRALITGGGERRGFKRETSIIMMLWFLSMLYASFRGVRFTVFLLVPLGIQFGCFVNDLYARLARGGRRREGIAVALLALSLVSWVTVQRADRIARNIYPLMNDPWYKVLVAMRDGTPPDTTINSWWDFGDWFKVVSQRKVIFDGQSQNKPQAYWMAKALLSNNEDESIGILRMLNNGGNKAFETIDEYIKDPLQSMLLLESVIPLGQQQARDILADFLPASAVDKVSLLLFDAPGSAVFVVDYSMIFKIPAISYLGNWNFSKVYMVQNFNKKEKDNILDHLIKLGKESALMQKFYQELFLIPQKNLDNWISRPVQFYEAPVRGVRKDDAVYFENGFVLDIRAKTFSGNKGQVPLSFFLQQGDRMVEVPLPNPTMQASVLIVENNGQYAAIAMDRELAGSLFVRLYILQGAGLKHFRRFIDANDQGNYIGVFKIDWSGTEAG